MKYFHSGFGPHYSFRVAIHSLLLLRRMPTMTTEHAALPAWRKRLRLCRQILAVLLGLFGLSMAYAVWGKFHCSANAFDFSVGRNDYSPFLLALTILAGGMGLWFWEESPRPLGVAILMLPLSLVLGAFVGAYRCGQDIGPIRADASFVIASLICGGLGWFLLTWKRKPIPRPAAENAFSTKTFNAVSGLGHTRAARVIAGAAAIITLLHFAQPASTASNVANDASRGTAQVACSRYAAHAGEPGATGVAFDAINVAAALEPCAEAAKSPDATPLDQYHYGRVLDAKKVYVDAAGWYLKAANRGHAQAQYRLGVFYIEGMGVPRNYSTGVEWLRKSANQGNVFAQYGMGYAYGNGEGVPKDTAIAAQWYRKAADKDYPDALLNLAAIEWNSRGALQDKAQALKHMRRAAALGNATAKKNLVVMEDDKAANDRLDAYAKSLGPFGELMRAAQKKLQRNGYYDKDANGVSQYDRDAEEVQKEQEAQERERNARRQQELNGELLCGSGGQHYAGVFGCQ
jgi:TPR repeat protein